MDEFNRPWMLAIAMSMNASPATRALVDKLACLVALSAEDRTALRALPDRLEKVRAGERIRAAGEVPASSFLLLEGIACASKEIEPGRRQITSFYIPGDMPGLRALHLKVADGDLTAVTACEVAHFEHSHLLMLCRAHPAISDGLWKCTLLVSSIFQEWIANVGSRPAVSRLAHLFCEMLVRLEAAGLARDDTCELPLTQAHLGEATGLSRIHVNRSLQALRKQGLLEFEVGKLTVLDREGLMRAGGFSPEYLFLEQPSWRSEAGFMHISDELKCG